MKKFYLYTFTMESARRSTPKSSPNYYLVSNQDLRFGFTENWKNRKSNFKEVYGPHAVVLREWDTELDKDEMREVKRTVKKELKKSFILSGDTIKNSLSRKDEVIAIINTSI